MSGNCDAGRHNACDVRIEDLEAEIARLKAEAAAMRTALLVFPDRIGGPGYAQESRNWWNEVATKALSHDAGRDLLAVVEEARLIVRDFGSADTKELREALAKLDKAGSETS